MTAFSQDDFIHNKKRVRYIKALPSFAMLSVDEALALASVMFEKTYEPGETIVAENDLIDHVYIIVKGMAEVTHQTTHKNQTENALVAILMPGESIGLNDTSFFSTSGQCSATVIAQTEVMVLGLSIKDLHSFLAKNSHLQSAMVAVAGQVLRLRLIKQALPFHRLSHERLTWLAAQVEEVVVPAGKTLFKQGDEGDRCYLIRSGKVEIISTDEEGTAHTLAELTAPTLFGEATLITRAPRNATARVVEQCELLVLRYSHLSELIEREKNVANMFMTLMVDRSRPLQNSEVTEHPRTTADGHTVVILKNPDNGRYFKLSDQGEFIWQQLNGEHTLQEITLALADQFNIFAPDVVTALISKLAKAGFITNIAIDETTKFKSQPLWVRVVMRIRQLLEARVAISDADKWITKTYNKIMHLFFTPLGQAMLAILTIFGLAGFIYSTGSVATLFQTIPHSWTLLILLVPCTIISIALHELGHAYATKAFGYEVHYMGIGWNWLSPVAFADTSDMWLSTRGPRTAVNLAGAYTDVITGGIAALLIFAIHSAYGQAFLWLFALFAYVNAFRVLSPLQEQDGYYVLLDLFKRPQLRQSAIQWLIKDFPKALRSPSLFKKNGSEVCYWLICIVYLILVYLLTSLIQAFVFKILGIHSSNPFVSLALPFFVVLVSSLSMIADVRSQA